MTLDHARIYVAGILAADVSELEDLVGSDHPAATARAKTMQEAAQALGMDESYARALAAARRAIATARK